MTPNVRYRIYVTAAAVLGVLAAYGIVADDKVPLWLTLVSALFGVGAPSLAARNTPRES